MAENGSNRESWEARFDRMDRTLERLINDHVWFEDEHKKLLTAQVILAERVENNAVAIRELREAQREAQKYTDERLNALIAVVGDLVRHRPPQAP